MADQPDWARMLRAIEGLSVAEPDLTVSDVLSLWIAGADLETIARRLAVMWLGGAEIARKEEPVRVLAVPARINALADTLGAAYWQVLARAPPAVLVSKAAHQRIRDVLHDVLLIDIVAWRAWSAEHRDPATLTNAELMRFVVRIRRLTEEKKAIADDIKNVFAEAKASGFDVKVLRKVIAIADSETGRSGWNELAQLIDLYLDNLGM